MKQVYLAARYSRREEICRYREELSAAYQGTLVAMTFEHKNVIDFAAMLDEAKRQSGLLPNRPNLGNFE